jgi:hypothetical protein
MSEAEGEDTRPIGERQAAVTTDHAKLPFVATTQRAGQLVSIAHQVHAVERSVDRGVQLRLWDVFDAREEFQVLADGEQIQERVELRACAVTSLRQTQSHLQQHTRGQPDQHR